MPKNSPKTYPKKAKPKKIKPKDQPKRVNLLGRKSYWVTLTVTMVVFAFVYTDLLAIPLEKVGLLLSTILVMIGFAFYVGFKPLSYNKRATFIFVGASVIGFSFWAAIVLSFDATGITSQIANSLGVNFFAVTTLLICLIAGAFIGDLIGRNREKITLLTYRFRN